jgi:hypothetical protein
MQIVKLTMQSVRENPHPLGLLHLNLILFSALHFAVFGLQCYLKIGNFALQILQFALIFKKVLAHSTLQ